MVLHAKTELGFIDGGINKSTNIYVLSSLIIKYLQIYFIK